MGYFVKLIYRFHLKVKGSVRDGYDFLEEPNYSLFSIHPANMVNLRSNSTFVKLSSWFLDQTYEWSRRKDSQRNNI